MVYEILRSHQCLGVGGYNVKHPGHIYMLFSSQSIVPLVGISYSYVLLGTIRVWYVVKYCMACTCRWMQQRFNRAMDSDTNRPRHCDRTARLWLSGYMLAGKEGGIFVDCD